MHIIVSLLLLALNIQKKTWRNLPKYYHVLIYVSVFNCLYYVLCRNSLMWELKCKTLSTRAVRVLHILVVVPLLILLYLSDVPKSLSKQIVYICKWIMVSMFVEFIGQKLKMISFHNGWNLYWSILIYTKMYIYSMLMVKKPLLTWMISIVSTIFFLLKFKVPVKHNVKMQLEGCRSKINFKYR
ncbi:CBO0543 family protein [Alkalibacillus sp. S2W]|uniref:CBO0543 family protein n=1 Tax=Alkalibacillus sp. S2W TaxID=3386553 RepID=UPI00398CC6DC